MTTAATVSEVDEMLLLRTWPMSIPTAGAMPSHNPKIKDVWTDWRKVGLSPPSTIDIRKLSRLRVTPRTRSVITGFVRSRRAICHGANAVADRVRLRRCGLLRQRECEQRRPARLRKGAGIKPLGPSAIADRDRDELPPVDHVGAGARVVAAAAGVLPKEFSAAGVERPEYPCGIAGEHQVAAGGQHRGGHRVLILESPLLLARGRIKCGEVAGHVFGVHGNARTPVRDALLEL